MRYGRRVVLPGLLVVAACVVVCAWAWGSVAAGSALLGGLGVVVLLSSTPGVLGPVATVLPGASLAAALIFYLTKVMVMAVAFVVLSSPERRDDVDTAALGGTVVVTTLAWTALLLVAALRSRQLVYDQPSDSPKSPDTLTEQ